jgi:molybdopterin synthase sulfur carrier subunit
MININLKYFASVREALGKDSETITTQAATVAALRSELIAKGAPYASALSNPRLRAAVNHAMVDDTTTIADGNEVAFFPPVTGG